ncbi:MAG: peptidoglycan-binding protein [Phycisphaerae bacterium]|nr:peptidoglycan-binding protein [Phycisphaerae bacterium]
MNALYRRGQSGNQIELIQRRLAEMGLDPGPIDGIFGPLTLAAVRKLQSRHGLPVDGVVGPQTWDLLFKAAPSVLPMRKSGATRHTGAVFICYRRNDSADVVGRIYDRLVERFGRDAVFKDVDSIPLGQDFRHYLSESMARFAVVVVAIGTKWLSCEGAERLGQDRDFVRIEIESALKLGVPVIPVLVQGATMPGEQDLPTSIARLAYYHGLAVRPDPDFRHDISRLIEGIERILEKHPQVEQ